MSKKPADSDRIKRTILENAGEIVRLDALRRKAFAQRNQSQEKWSDFYRAGAELSSRYNSVAFPRGLKGAYERIDSGDPDTIEEAICFLEVRPHFFLLAICSRTFCASANERRSRPSKLPGLIRC